MVADRDFVLRWQVTVASPTLAALAHKDAGTSLGHLALIVQPPPVDAGKAPPRELVFVVDTSGSMSGEPLALAKRGMRYALEHLRPEDSFRILNFSSDVTAFEDGRAMLAIRDNVRAGMSFVNGLDSGGGTEMLSGIVAALSAPPADGRARFVVFMTDGYIGNEDEIFAAVEKHLDKRTHLFSFGVGSSVNRHLLDGLAKSGKGVAQYLLLDQAPEPQVASFYARLDSPLLHSLEIDWGGLDVRDATPGAIGDLFAGQPIVLAARFGKSGSANVTVRGKAAGRTVELTIPVTLPATGGDGEVLARLWARRRIGEQMERLASGWNQAIIDDITSTALDHSLLSKWTSFVAIDERPRAEGMPSDTIAVPVELPHGVTPAAGNVVEEYVMADPGAADEDEDADALGGGGSRSMGASYSVEELAYYAPGIDTSLVRYKRYASRRPTLRLSVSAGLGLGAGDDEYIEGGFGVEMLGRSAPFGYGFELRVADRGENPTLVQAMITFARLAIMRRLDLRLGVGMGIATQDPDNPDEAVAGFSWRTELGVPLGLSRHLGTELTFGTHGSFAGENYVGTGVGVGLRW
jgi:Ca-activated chloride channel family protein